MPKLQENQSVINLKVPCDLKYKIKLKAVKEHTTMQALILNLIKTYCNDEAEFEDLDEEDLKDLEIGDKEYEAGEYKTFEQVKDEYGWKS
jgi:uncharacterized membrane protein YkoI